MRIPTQRPDRGRAGVVSGAHRPLNRLMLEQYSAGYAFFITRQVLDPVA